MATKIRSTNHFQGVLIWLIAVNLLLSVNFKVNGAQNETPVLGKVELNNGIEFFIKARRMYYNAEAPLNEVKKVLNDSKESVANLPEGFDKCYWKANLAYLSGEIAEVFGDKQQAAADFTESNEQLLKALNYNPKSSDANRVLADTIMRLMDYRGVIYMMTKGPQALKLLKKALDLDEKNYTAMNSLGMYYINAPAIGGGSVDKGIEVLQKALESKDHFDNFISNVWLGTAFQKKKNSGEAEEHYQRALGIYPNSPWVKKLIKSVE